MTNLFPQSYSRVFQAAFDAAVSALAELPDAELEQLARYSGIVGLAAEAVRGRRERDAGTAPPATAEGARLRRLRRG